MESEHNNYLLSLCIPTNGITEWVIQVLEHIYNQGADEKNFEVIITDNGNSDECREAVQELYGNHENLVYKRTEAYQFLNQIEAFKIATGVLIKFINHRSLLQPGSIDYLIDFANAHKDDEQKPITFFIEGNLNHGNKSDQEILNNFDSFIKALEHMSSFSGALSAWKEDFEKIPQNIVCNTLFPHTTLLFYFRDRNTYIIDRHILSKNIPTTHAKKGKYKLYYAFGVEYPSIILDMVRSGDVSMGTFLSVLKANEKFVCNCYQNFSICKEPHSYDLSGADEYLNVYYRSSKIKRNAWLGLPFKLFRITAGKCYRKIKSIFRG